MYASFACVILALGGMVDAVEVWRRSLPLSDSFSNSYRVEQFCTRRNAACTNVSCEVCQCLSGMIFYSYQHGCLDKQKVENVIKDRLCAFHTDRNTIPLIDDNTLKTCTDISCKFNVTDCTVESVYFTNVIKGNSEYLYTNYFELSKKGSATCLKLSDQTVDLVKTYGMLLKLMFSCSLQGTIILVPFMMRVNGSYRFDGEFTTEKTKITSKVTTDFYTPTTSQPPSTQSQSTSLPTNLYTPTTSQSPSTQSLTTSLPTTSKTVSGTELTTEKKESATLEPLTTKVIVVTAELKKDSKDVQSMVIIIGISGIALLLTVIFLAIIMRKLCKKATRRKEESSAVQLAASDSGDQIATVFLNDKEKLANHHKYQTIQQPLMVSRNETPYDYAYSNMAGINTEQNNKESFNAYYEGSKLNQDGRQNSENKNNIEVNNPTYVPQNNSKQTIYTSSNGNPIYTTSYALPEVGIKNALPEYLYPTCPVNVNRKEASAEYTYAVSKDDSQNPLYVKNCTTNPIYIGTDIGAK